MDIVDTKRRSWMMSRIKGVNTRPEVAVRKVLHSMGLRYRLHRTDLPGKPDIVLPKHKTVVFVHGCFWHRHKPCNDATLPKSNTEFWEKKFAANVERDLRAQHQLAELGWRIVIVWECELNNREALSRRLVEIFSS